jgi:calcium-dependent protein kinase
LEKPGKIDLDYTLLNPPIGKGAFGIVRRGIHKKSGLQRAVKITPKEKVSKKHEQKLLNEINILKKLVSFFLF